jgi:hypothetical protein
MGPTCLMHMISGERPGLDGQLLSTTHLPQTPEDLAELGRLETARDARHALGDLEEQPEEQGLREWTAYVEALKTRVEAMAATTPGSNVPVRVSVDADAFRRDAAQPEGFWISLESRLFDAAVMNPDRGRPARHAARASCTAALSPCAPVVL